MYTKIFNPPSKSITAPPGTDAGDLGDRRDGSVYVYDDDIVLAVNVGLVTGRCLLVSGPPGSGKSSLAANVARVLAEDPKQKTRWAYDQHTITPRTQAQDLLWRYDAVRRLRDAQAQELARDIKYIEPGILWRAFAESHAGVRTVVLLDEIDKADPDVPNSLLVALGSLDFEVEDLGERVTARKDAPPFVILTTNDERELPRPFLRRCVTLTLKPPDVDRLLEIARVHELDKNRKLARSVAEHVVRIGETDARRPPNAAEFIDALRACLKMKINPESDEWALIEEATLVKRSEASSGRV